MSPRSFRPHAARQVAIRRRASSRFVELRFQIISAITMSDHTSHDEFTTQAKRLLRYRVPLVLGLLINCALIVRVPLSQMRGAPSPETGRTGQVAPTLPANARQATSAHDPQLLHTELSRTMAVAKSPANVDTEQAAAAEFAPVAQGPELEFRTTTAIPFHDDPADFEPRPNDSQGPATRPSSANDFAWTSMALTTRLSPLADAWNRHVASFWHRQDLEEAAQVAEQPMVIEFPASKEAAEPAAHPPADLRRQLQIENPTNSGGTVKFLIDGRPCTLRPGESRSLPTETPHRIQFHRGGKFGNADIRLSEGHFKFQVSNQGWQLITAK